MPRFARHCAVLAAVALLALTACGGDDDEPTVAGGQPSTTAAAPTTAGGSPVTTAAPPTTGAPGTVLSVTVRGGSVVEGASRQRATLNQPVTIRVTSDVAEEVHVHGYDKIFPVAANSRGETTFVANIPGVFEVEFERSHKVLFTLEVR
jgi:hypothetical protein